MPVPTVYSEGSLAVYLVDVLGPLAAVLGWDTDTPNVRESVTDALLDCDELDISTFTSTLGLRKLRTLGRRAIWRAVVQATASFYAFTDVGQQQFSRQQINDQARKMLELAETECAQWDPAYAVGIVSVRRPNDPYVVIPDTERVP